MVSRRRTGSRRARAHRPERGEVTEDDFVVPLFAGQATVSDVTLALCQRWFLLRREADRLQDRWSDLEAWLGKHHGWYETEPSQRPDRPEKREMDQIDARLDEIRVQEKALELVLPSLPAPSPAAIAAKLQVAAKLIWPHDNLPARRLIIAAIQDVRALARDNGP